MSIELKALSLLLSLSLAVPAGMLAAYRAGQSIDKLLSALAAPLLSAPSFMLGLVLMFFLALALKWLPAVGYVPLSEGILRHEPHRAALTAPSSLNTADDACACRQT